MPTRVILDTDIGTDVDDCLALALLLASPELKLEGVTCVYGDVDLRVRMAEKLMELRGLKNIPVRAGARKPLLGLREVYWEGHEGQVGRLRTLLGDGTYPGKCLSCGVEHRPFSVSPLEIIDGFVVVEEPFEVRP